MTTHRSYLLLDAVAEAVTGLATTGTNVERTRGYPNSETPALTVRLANIDPQNEISNAFLDSVVEIETIYHVSGPDDDLDRQVLAIDAEVYSAIMADRTMSGFAIDADPGPLTFTDAADGEVPTAAAVRRWRFHSRHSITNPNN